MADLNSENVTSSLPPQNIDAEESILGGILLDPEAISRVADILIVDAFYLKSHREIYQAAMTLYTQDKPTDLITMKSWLEDQGLLEKVGGANKLAQLIDRTVSAVNIDRYAILVMGKYLRRQLITAGHEIVDLGYDNIQELTDILDQSEQKIFKLTQERIQQGLIHISEPLRQTFNEVEKLQEQVALPGISCDFYDLDAMTGGFGRSDLIIIAGRPSMGKCCEANSEIVLADGTITTIANIYNQQKAELLTLTHHGVFRLTKPTNFVDDGMKPVFRVTTCLGRFLETTITHPYLTPNGWQKLSRLNPGDYIAIPRLIPIFGTQTLSDTVIKLLAYYTADGDINKCLPTDFNQLATEFLSDINSVSPSPLLSPQNLLYSWLKGFTKKTINPIPESIFTLKRSHLALFITALFNTTNSTDLIYLTYSEKIARQLQHLLNRFAIIAEVKYQDLTKSWQLKILENKPLETLLNLREIEQQIYWDKIVTIESKGYKQVYDLTIPETHNFIANDICVHNTSFALNIASNIAVKHNLPVAIFSLEMSKEQLSLRLLAGEAGIESNRLRAGRITQTENGQLSEALVYLSQLPIYIDDSANLKVVEMRSLVRRLQAEKRGKLGLVLLDYLQLMEGGGDNRVQELSRITRSLKGLAREMNVPVIALSQLSRGVEARTNKRPMLSDLRESGCLSGESLISLSNGNKIPIQELEGKENISILALNLESMELETAISSRAFCSGIKDIFSLITNQGNQINATANHRFFTTHGWQRLDNLKIGDRIVRSDKNHQIIWDEVKSIIPQKPQKVYDLTVPKYENFLANQLVVHNSIEQDADLVIMLYRDEYYSPDTPERGVAEVIVAKHRNGPTGTIRLLFRPELTKFLNLKSN